MDERGERPRVKEMNMSANLGSTNSSKLENEKRKAAPEGGCCSSKEQESCCAASEKSACCGTPSRDRSAPSTCGCR